MTSSRRRHKLVTDLVAFIRRFVVMTDEQALVMALYVVHTHLVEVCEQTPYITVTSPERGCGKSRLLEVLELLVAESWMIVSPSDAVLFRKVHATTPTILWDEIDAVFAPKAAQHHEDQRALLDQGHRRFGTVPRFIGDKVMEFNVFCPKVLAGIGALPDTIASRAIPIRLQRRKRSEPIDRFIRRDVRPDGEVLAGRVANWAGKYGPRVAIARPEMPEELDDRMQEGCESLVAVADIMGCGKAARAALVQLLHEERLDAHETWRVRLLRDVKTVCEAKDVHRAITTETLLEGLCGLPESSWLGPRYYGRQLEDKDLATLLLQYGVKPQLIKFKTGARRGYRLYDYMNKRGEEIVGLRTAWERYAVR